jgi:hypothetical protein
VRLVVWLERGEFGFGSVLLFVERCCYESMKHEFSNICLHLSHFIQTYRPEAEAENDDSSISSKSHSSSVLMEDALPTPSHSALPPHHYTPGELDQAIENGNWEAVAASAAAIVSQSRSEESSSNGMKEVV